MVKPIAAQPSRNASWTEAVSADQGWSGPPSESLLLSFKISGRRPAYSRATSSSDPSGAAYALQPASTAMLGK
jgi:hypothetical protein